MTHHNPRTATVLIGLRGSGKTTLGRLLAARLGAPFIDLDDRTVAGSGHASVSAMFRAQGEPAFRAAEVRALAEVLASVTRPAARGSGHDRPNERLDAGADARPNMGPQVGPNAGPRIGPVIALGGGTPTAPGARELIDRARAEGRIRVVLLEASPAVLGARLAVAPGDRPLLLGADFAEEAALLAERRLPTYRAIADAAVATDGDTEAALERLVTFAKSVPG